MPYSKAIIRHPKLNPEEQHEINRWHVSQLSPNIVHHLTLCMRYSACKKVCGNWRVRKVIVNDDCLGIRHETRSSNNFGLVSFSIVFSSAQFSAVLSALCGLRLIPSLYIYIYIQVQNPGRARARAETRAYGTDSPSRSKSRALSITPTHHPKKDGSMTDFQHTQFDPHGSHRKMLHVLLTHLPPRCVLTFSPTP